MRCIAPVENGVWRRHSDYASLAVGAVGLPTRQPASGRPVTCPYCERELRVPRQFFGHEVECNFCGRQFQLPPATNAPDASPRTSRAAAPYCPDAPLIYRNYGVPYTEWTPAEARARGLRYFYGRWVNPDDHRELVRQGIVIHGPRLFFWSGVMLAGLVVVWQLLLMLLERATNDDEVAAFLVIACAFAGWAALWYGAARWSQVCRWTLLVLSALATLFLTAPTLIELFSGHPMPSAVVISFWFLLVALWCGLAGIVWILASPQAFRLYRFHESRS